MPRNIILDEIHLTAVAPARLPDSVCNTACRTLKSPRFFASLRGAAVRSFGGIRR
jgi:hypothetical protein